MLFKAFLTIIQAALPKFQLMPRNQQNITFQIKQK
jgi:hypothetical protein